MIMSTGVSSAELTSSEVGCSDLAGMTDRSVALLVRIAEEQKTWKRELDDEIVRRQQLAQEVKDESLKCDKLAEELSQISKDRIAAETEIVASFRKVMEQSAAFRDAVCQEAVEQRTVLAKDITSGLEATLEERLADLRLMLEKSTTSLNHRCDAHEDRSAAAAKSLEYLTQRCKSNEVSVTGNAEIRCSLEALAEELQRNLAEARRCNDSIDARCSTIEQRVALLEEKSREESDSYRRSQDMFSALAEDVKEEVKARTLLGNRLRTEEEQHQKQISTVWSEVANVQQQITEMRESLRLEIQSQLIQQKQASEDRLSSLIVSLQSWQEKSSQSFEKHSNDVSALREHMTEHLSWVAKEHEGEVTQLKAQMLSIAEQTKEVSAQVSSLQESDRIARASDTTAISRGSEAPMVRQTSQVASVARSSGSLTPTPSATRLRPVSPLRSMPQPPAMVPQKSCHAPPATLSGDASIPISAASGRNLPKPPEIGSTASQGCLQRTPSVGLLSARFNGPARNIRS